MNFAILREVLEEVRATPAENKGNTRTLDDAPEDCVIEITPEMILAGVRAYLRWDQSEKDPECMVAEVFYDMFVASHNPKRINARHKVNPQTPNRDWHLRVGIVGHDLLPRFWDSATKSWTRITPESSGGVANAKKHEGATYK